MKFFKDTKLTVDVYTSEIKMIENHIASILGRLNKLEELNIKPEPKPDVVEYLRVGRRTYSSTLEWSNSTRANLKLTYDGETGDLKSAEVIK